jgi:hypothetical protein
MKSNRNSPRNKLVLYLTIALLGCVLLVWLCSSSGPFVRFWHFDASFLIPPLLVWLFLFLLAAIFPLVIIHNVAKILAVALRYVAVAISCALVLQHFELFSRIAILGSHLDALYVIKSSALWVVLFWIGAGLYHLSNYLRPGNASGPGYRPVISMLGFLAMGTSLWRTMDIVGTHWSALQGSGIVLGLSMIVVSLSRLVAYITTPLSFLISDVLKWMLVNPVKLFWVTILIMLYFIFARPRLYALLPYAYLIEWVFVCFIGYQILNSVKQNLQAHNYREAIQQDWRKHQQIVNRIEDEDFNKMIILQDEFIQSGLRRNLLYFLQQLLLRNGVSESQITDILQPVIEYNDARTRWYSRWFFKNRLEQKNLYRRIQVMDDAMDRIRTGVFSESYVGTGDKI